MGDLRSAYEDIIGREIAYHNNSNYWVKVKRYANELAVMVQMDRQEKEFGKPK